MIFPSLIISRFLVVKDGYFAYDEQFFPGVNIVRGANGTGKSTVVDLLYFALGAEYKDWTDEQFECDYTIVEVVLNSRLFCLRREITTTGKSSMDAFEGPIEDALNTSLNWSRYPYSRNSQKHSFSQKLFELMDMPQHKTDDSQNLTMHQILRLIYVDQITQTTQLLKAEPQFDKSVTRRAIGEFLLGLDDMAIHGIRQKLIQETRKLQSSIGELKSIYKVLGTDPETYMTEFLEVEKQNVRDKIAELNGRKEKIRTAKLDSLASGNSDKCKKLSASIHSSVDKLNSLIERRASLLSEIEETKSFVSSLEYRLTSLSQSKTANEEIGIVSFKFCPLCLKEIGSSHNSDECSLCKTDIAGEHRAYSYIQMTNEINFQLVESHSLIERFEKEVASISRSINSLREKVVILQTEYNELNTGIDIKDSALSEVSSQIGFYQCELLRLDDKLTLANQIDGLEDAKSVSEKEIEKLEKKVQSLEKRREKRLNSVYEDIESIAKDFLVGDGGYEIAFENPEQVAFDFGKDKMFVNGRSKFSASSMVVMKNAIRSAIFFQSIVDEDSRFPRLLLMDNIEDKGMAPDRSQNFQRLLVSKCKEYDDDCYQLIFSTSMIDPELDKSDFVVGPHYEKGSHTLNFKEDGNARLS